MLDEVVATRSPAVADDAAAKWPSPTPLAVVNQTVAGIDDGHLGFVAFYLCWTFFFLLALWFFVDFSAFFFSSQGPQKLDRAVVAAEAACPKPPGAG